MSLDRSRAATAIWRKTGSRSLLSSRGIGRVGVLVRRTTGRVVVGSAAMLSADVDA
jgi:hypothetical protein